MWGQGRDGVGSAAMKFSVGLVIPKEGRRWHTETDRTTGPQTLQLKDGTKPDRKTHR